MAGQKYATIKQLAIKIMRPYGYELSRQIMAHRRIPNLTRPITFNDKAGHRKFYDFNPIYPTLADKAQVRNFIAQKVGENILSRIYFCGNDLAQINLDELPDSFVIKATHGSGPGYIAFIDGRAGTPPNQIERIAHDLIAQDYGAITNEWWYAQIKPQILIEEMLRDETHGTPVDYKFFVFHGKVHFIQVDYARFAHHTRTFYDPQWKPQPFSLKYPQGPLTAAPPLLAEMLEIAETLGQGFDFIRVDLYCVNDRRIVFGEMTLTPEAGWGRFKPTQWDAILGQLW
jgi:hypothetical protein